MYIKYLIGQTPCCQPHLQFLFFFRLGIFSCFSASNILEAFLIDYNFDLDCT